MQEYNFNLDTIIGDPSIRSGHFGVHYRGINYVKFPFDYVMYQMIFEEVKPDLVIEIGTYMGGGALYMADILDRIGNGIVHTIDIQYKKYSDLVLNHNRIKTFFDGYQGYNIDNVSKFEKILVIDDGSHIYDDVINAFCKFKDVVTKESYYIVEDSIVSYDNKQLNGGPHKAIMEIIQNNSQYTIDRKWCDFFGKNATSNPDGYLRRVS